jgi:uncharacterized protein (DUF1499 family)
MMSKLRLLAMTSFALAVLGAALELLAGPGYRLGWWSLGGGLLAMRWGASGAALAACLGLAALLWGAWAGHRRAIAWAAVAALIGVAAAAPPLWLWREVQRLPHLHDIATDTAAPLAFVALLPLRRAAPNGADYAPADAALQHAAYPDIAPLHLAGVPPAAALERARRAMHDMGWRIAAEAPQEGRLEATATSLLFGFKDDIVVRVATDGAGSRVDVRSASRVGGSDFGANAARVREFLRRVAQ